VNGQHIEKAKKKKNSEGGEIKIEGSFSTPYNWAIGHTLAATSGGSDCSYTLDLEYARIDKDTGGVTTGYTSSHTFDDTLTGIGGSDLQIDFDEAVLENTDKDISCVRVRSRLEEVLIIYGAKISSQNATSSQWLREVDDRTDAATVLDLFPPGTTGATGTGGLGDFTDAAAGGVLFSPLVGLGGISVGGVVAGTENCPAGVNWDDAPGGTSSSGSTSTTDPGTDPPPPGGSTLPSTTGGSAVVPLNPGFNITNTTGSGNNQSGRLMWREIVR
jgi:hypothetical protein